MLLLRAEGSSPQFPAAVPVSRERASRRDIRVLIIDDEKDLVEILVFRIQAVGGFVVETAPDGELGLEKAVKFRPDVILLDLLLPNIDGWEVCRRLRARDETRAIPVVLMTALRSRGIEEEAELLGIHRVLVKPFEDRHLVEILKRALPGGEA